jgi:hypothetical protein
MTLGKNALGFNYWVLGDRVGSAFPRRFLLSNVQHALNAAEKKFHSALAERLTGQF